MKTEKLRETLKEIACDIFEEEYPGLNDAQKQKGSEVVVENLMQDKDFVRNLLNEINNSVDTIYNSSILPEVATKFDTPKQGDVTMAYHNRKIILHRDNKDKKKATIEFGHSVFPVYWFEDGNVSDETLIEKLSFLLNDLPLNIEIQYPYVQIWASLENWQRWAYYSKEELEQLERILEIGSKDNPDYEDVLQAWESRSKIYNARDWWPHHIKKVLSFEKPSKGEKELCGRMNISLRDDSTIQIDIGADKRKRNYYSSTKDEYQWEIKSFTAVDKPFPLFSQKDRKVLNDYLNENIKIKDAA